MQRLAGRFLAILVVGGVSLVLVACGGAPSASEVRQRTAEIVGTALIETADAADQAANHEGLKALVSLFKDLGGDRLVGIDAPPETAPSPAPAPRPQPVPSNIWRGIDTKELKRDAAKIAQELEQTLARTIFADANVESQRGGTTTFLLGDGTFCGRISRTPTPARPVLPPPIPGETQPAPRRYPSDIQPSNSCKATLAKLQIRIDASFAGDGLDFGLRVGTGATLIVIELRSNRITVKAMLGAIKPALAEISNAIGSQRWQPPRRLSGVIAVSLLRQAKGSYRAKLSVAQNVSLEMDYQGERVRLDLPAITPMVDVALSADKLSLLIKTAGGTLSSPARLLFGRSIVARPPQPITVKIPAMEAKLSAGQDGKVKIDQLWLGAGALQMLLGQSVLASLTINKDTGGKLGLELSRPASGPRWTFNPGLDLRLALQMNQLDAYIRRAAEPWSADETYRVRLQGVTGQKPAIAALSGKDALLKVLDGKLIVETKVRPQKLVVESGTCLFWQDQTSSDYLMDNLATGTCSY